MLHDATGELAGCLGRYKAHYRCKSESGELQSIAATAAAASDVRVYQRATYCLKKLQIEIPRFIPGKAKRKDILDGQFAIRNIAE